MCAAKITLKAWRPCGTEAERKKRESVGGVSVHYTQTWRQLQLPPIQSADQQRSRIFYKYFSHLFFIATMIELCKLHPLEFKVCTIKVWPWRWFEEIVLDKLVNTAINF